MAVGSYLYIHERLDTNLPFYVGKGSKNRAKSKNYRNQYWHNVANKVGFTPKILQDNMTNVQALNAEKLTIALFRKFFKLVNIADGGEGGNGLKGKNHPLYGKPRTDEVKKKVSNALKGKSFPHSKNKLGTTQSIETKKKISKALKGRKQTIEHIQNAKIGFKNAMALRQKDRVKS